MPEYIMQYDLDEFGKLINARRKEELVRCKDCAKCVKDNAFHAYWCEGSIVRPDGYCDEGVKR